MTVQGLPITRIVNVGLDLAPVATSMQSFSTCLIETDSPAIDVVTRSFVAASPNDVATKVGSNSAAFAASLLWFAQGRRTVTLWRYAPAGSNGQLFGGPLASVNSVIAPWAAINNGQFGVSIDGNAIEQVGPLDFTAQGNLNGVAAVITAKLSKATVTAGAPVNPGVTYAPGDTITIGGGIRLTPAVLDVSHVKVVNISIAAAGASGTDGAAVITGTTGTGTKFTANVTIAGGELVSIQSIVLAGDYTVNPVSLAAEPVTGGDLIGAEVSLVMGVLAVTVATPGTYSTLPAGPAGQSATTGVGTGATFNLTYGATAGTQVSYDPANDRFSFTNTDTGVASTVSFLTPGLIGTDVSGMLAGLAASAGAYVANGIAPETALATVQLADAKLANAWYGVTLPDVTADNDILAVAAYIEADPILHYYGVSTQDPNTRVADNATCIAAKLAAGKFKRTTAQFSTSNANSVAAYLGVALSIDFNANNSVITPMFQGETLVTPEVVDTDQANAIQAKFANIFAQYTNNAAIVQYGTSASGDDTDEIVGLDWLSTAIQSNVWNGLYTSTTKIPQTDQGMNTIANWIGRACEQAVINGLLAPGTWTGPTIGSVTSGTYLTLGYKILWPSVASQSDADRAAGLSVPFTVLVKIAGAVKIVQVNVKVNR